MDVPDADVLAAVTEVEAMLADTFDMKPTAMQSMTIKAAEAQASTDWALCEETGGTATEESCEAEVKERFIESGSTSEDFEVRKTKIKKVKKAKIAGDKVKIVKKTDEV